MLEQAAVYQSLVRKSIHDAHHTSEVRARVLQRPIAPQGRVNATELPPFRIPGFALRAAFIDTRAYIAAGPGGVQVVDLSSPATPRIIGAYKTATAAVDVAVDGSLMLVAVRPGDVIILRATWH